MVKSRKYIREDRCATEGCVGKQHQHRHMSRAEQERQERLFNERSRDWDDFLSTLGKQPEKMHSEIGKRKAHQLAVGSSDAGFNEAAGSACDEQAVNEAEDSLPLVTNSEAAFCNDAEGSAGGEQAHQLAVGSSEAAFCNEARMVLSRRDRARALELVLRLYQETLDKWEFETELAWMRFVWRVERELHDEFERDEQERWTRQVAEIQTQVWAEEAMAQAWANQFQ